MKFVSLRRNIIKPTNQKIIDKRVRINKKDYHFINLYIEDNITKMLVIGLNDNVDDRAEIFEFETKREEMLNQIDNQDNSFLSIQTIKVNEKEFNSTSSRMKSCRENYSDYLKMSFYLKLNYISNLNINLSYLDEINIERINLSIYELEESAIEIFDYDSLNMSALIMNHGIQKKINKNLRLDFDIMNDCFMVEDNQTNKFSARLVEIDFWGEQIPKLKKKLEEVGGDFNEMLPEFEKTCPQNMNLLFVAYECENQLCFYLKESLDSEIEYNNGHFTFYFREDGTNEKYCLLKPVKKGEVKNIEVELFSYYTKFYDDNINI